MMNLQELGALRRRLIAARANKQQFGAAETYVAMLEAEATTDFQGRRASIPHLLALVEAAIAARAQGASSKVSQGQSDFHYRTSVAVSVTPAVIASALNEDVAPPVAEEPVTPLAPPPQEPVKKAPKRHRGKR